MLQNYLKYSSQNDDLDACMLIINEHRAILFEFGNSEWLLKNEVIVTQPTITEHILSQPFATALNKALTHFKEIFSYRTNTNVDVSVKIISDNKSKSIALTINKVEKTIEDKPTSTNKPSYLLKDKKKPLYVLLQIQCNKYGKYELIYCDPKSSDFLDVSLNDAFEYFSNFKDNLLEEDKISFQLNLNKSIDEQCDFIFEGRILMPNKDIIWVQCSFSPIGIENNKLKYSGIIIEITDRKNIENTLLKTNARLKTLLSHFTSGVILTNDKSKPIYVNPGFLKLFGFNLRLNEFLLNSPSLLRRTAEKVKEKRPFIAKISKITRSKKPSLNHQFEFLDGRFIVFDYVPITENELWIGHLWIFRDVTAQIEHEKELRDAKEAAENSERTKSAFLASMSHELRTPLNGILGCSDAITDITEEASVKRMAHIIELSGRRLLDSLNSILDLSALQAGKVITYKTIFNVNELIEDHVNLFKIRAYQQKLSLTFHEDNLFNIYNDKKLLSKVLDNLINNAIKFTKVGGISIHLSTENSNNTNWLKIIVSDTGIGIKKENQHLIFESFRQVSEGYRREFDGTGLGLNLTQQYLQLMGGTISVSSEFGKGSTFTIQIPGVQQTGSIPAMHERTPIYNKRNYLDKKVFIVEDDATNLSVLEFQLENYVQAEFASNRTEAIEKLSKNQYDIVLLDIHLGKNETGVDILNYMRKNELHLKTPTIAITAHAMPKDQEKLLSAGFNAYLSKPYTKNALLTILSEYLSSKNQ